MAKEDKNSEENGAHVPGEKGYENKGDEGPPYNFKTTEMERPKAVTVKWVNSLRETGICVRY